MRLVREFRESEAGEKHWGYAMNEHFSTVFSPDDLAVEQQPGWLPAVGGERFPGAATYFPFGRAPLLQGTVKASDFVVIVALPNQTVGRCTRSTGSIHVKQGGGAGDGDIKPRCR